MRSIHPPARKERGSSDCAEAMQAAFEQLLDRAEQAGWSRTEVLRAVCVLTWRLAESEMPEGVIAA